MKKLWFLSVFVVPLIVLVLFTGCPSGGGGDVSVGKGSGSFTYDGTTYPLTNASIDDWQDGEFWLYIASAGIDAFEWTGIGDIIVFYTDGITETMNSKMEQYDENRLIQLLIKCRMQAPKKIINNILDDLKIFNPRESLRDDRTLLVLKVGN